MRKKSAFKKKECNPLQKAETDYELGGNGIKVRLIPSQEVLLESKFRKSVVTDQLRPHVIKKMESDKLDRIQGLIKTPILNNQH